MEYAVWNAFFDELEKIAGIKIPPAMPAPPKVALPYQKLQNAPPIPSPPGQTINTGLGPIPIRKDIGISPYGPQAR